MKKKNRFNKPESEVIKFTNDDIITESVTGSFNDTEKGDGDVFPKQPHNWW